MITAEQVARINAGIAASVNERRQGRNLVAQGRWREAEDDVARSKAYVSRQKKRSLLARPGAESIVGDTTDYLSSSFLGEGAAIRRAVGYVEINTPRSHATGSGFLISPRLFITNFHVIEDTETAQSAVVHFDREMDEFGRARVTTNFRLDPDAFALFSEVDQLDYAVLAVGPRLSGDVAIGDLGFCPLTDTPDRHVIGMPVNIVQHPNGWPKTLAMRNNLLTHRTERALLYETDTEHGASGSPVFNDNWDVIALHHWGSPFLGQADETETVLPLVNEGVRISAIVRDLRARMAALPMAKRLLLEEALALGASTLATGGNPSLGGPRLGGPRPSVPQPDADIVGGNGSARFEAIPIAAPVPMPSLVSPIPTHFIPELSPGATMNTNLSPDGSVRITIPLEISVRLGGSTSVASVETVKRPEPRGKLLTRAGEALKIDTDYATRSGYQAAFVEGEMIALPELNSTLKKSIAPLRNGEANAASGLLNYEHFSLVLHKTRRMAIYTATNIDGATYLSVDRKTGVANDAEAEKWFKDMRVSDAYTLNQEFYSEWSDYFDRGHLTRRTDPTWGTAEEAERANADTFHFANCSPQHFRFNQTAKFWQGAERFVLENGVLAAGTGKRISVFQGPIFNDVIDLWADDVQIPSSFFKVIVWRGASALKSVGIIIDQLALMAETRKALKPPAALDSVNVSQWRVSIATIEARTGLKFSQSIRDGDTINVVGQPTVGAEKATLIRDLSDLLNP